MSDPDGSESIRLGGIAAVLFFLFGTVDSGDPDLHLLAIDTSVQYFCGLKGDGEGLHSGSRRTKHDPDDRSRSVVRLSITRSLHWRSMVGPDRSFMANDAA